MPFRTIALGLLVLALPGCMTELSGARPDPRDAGSVPDAPTDAAVLPVDAALEHEDAFAVDAWSASDAEPAPDAAPSPDAAPAPDAGPAPDTGPPTACAPIVFAFDGPFTATEAEPTRRTDFDVADGLVFGRIEVELDFVRGPWAPDHPPDRMGMHNLFWLHRGTGRGWLDNSVGYLNFTSATNLRLETNLGITDPAIWSDVLAATGSRTTEGERYHVEYTYDAEGRRWWLRLSDADGVQISYREDVPILTEIVGRSPYSHGASAFFMEIGHVPWSPDHEGPEVATLGWTYSDVEVRFHRLSSTCP